nr:unnamed protein product [Callosobruchus chinensis]
MFAIDPVFDATKIRDETCVREYLLRATKEKIEIPELNPDPFSGGSKELVGAVECLRVGAGTVQVYETREAFQLFISLFGTPKEIIMDGQNGRVDYGRFRPFEIVGLTPEGRYEIRRVGKSLVTKAAKEQLRSWPSDWSMTMNMEELLQDLETE